MRHYTRINVSAGDRLSASDSVKLATIRKDGNIEIQKVSSPSGSELNLSEVSLTNEYFFQDWRGNEDVVTLCEMYIKDVEIIVADGVAKGFLTP